MGETTAISWADSTVNIWVGCQETGSPACEPCYARQHVEARFGWTTWGPHGERVETKHWRAKLRKIQRLADEHFAATGRPWFVFVNSLSDFFDNKAPKGLRAEAFAEFRKLRHIVILLLTKRPGNIEKMCEEAGGLPSNCAIGCTAVTQGELGRDLIHVLRGASQLGALFPFVSAEPMVEPLDFFNIELGNGRFLDAFAGVESGPDGAEHFWRPLAWVITGGPTDQGPHKAWPVHPAWKRSIRDQCASGGAAYQHKQNGEWLPVCWMDDDLQEAVYHPAPKRDPEARRRCRVEQTVMNGDGSLHPDPTDRECYRQGDRSMLMFKVGKKQAGRLIDGVLHDARPEVSA